MERLLRSSCTQLFMTVIKTSTIVEKHATKGGYFSVNAKWIDHSYHVISPGTVSLLEKPILASLQQEESFQWNKQHTC